MIRSFALRGRRKLWSSRAIGFETPRVSFSIAEMMKKHVRLSMSPK